MWVVIGAGGRRSRVGHPGCAGARCVRMVFDMVVVAALESHNQTLSWPTPAVEDSLPCDRCTSHTIDDSVAQYRRYESELESSRK